MKPAPVSQEIVTVASVGLCMGHRGCAGQVYMASASDQPCEFVNQYRFSFGLDDRYEKSLRGQSAIVLYRNLSL